MRQKKKFKQFSKLITPTKNFPSRILKFKRTKWKKIQFLSNQNSSYRLKRQNFTLKTVLLTKKWNRYKSNYKSSLQLKNNIDCVFDQNFSTLFFKKLKNLNIKKNRLLDFSVYLIKPEFRIDVFLWRLALFSSSYQARQQINNNGIFVNFKPIHPNYFLKKGDIISVKEDTINFFNIKKTLSKKILNTFFLVLSR